MYIDFGKALYWGLSVVSMIFHYLHSRLLSLSRAGKKYLTRLGRCGATRERNILAFLVVLGLLININYTHNLDRQQGFNITVSGGQYG
jgi:hypothetical protein